MSRVPAGVAVSAAAGYAALQFLGRRAGSTVAERAPSCRGISWSPTPHCHQSRHHHCCAGGRHLAVAHTDGLAPRRLLHPRLGRSVPVSQQLPSLATLDPQLVCDLEIGDTIPDGPPGTAEFVVAEVRRPYVLVLKSTTHVPPGWEAYGAAITWTWCVHLTSLDDGVRTRVHLRVRGQMSPWWFAALYVATVVPADFIMATGMLRGLRSRAEGKINPIRGE